MMSTHQNLATGVSVDDVGISDCALVSVYLNLHRAAPNTRRVTYRNIKAVDPVKYTEMIGAEKIYTSPPADIDAFADELDASVTRVMAIMEFSRARMMPWRIVPPAGWPSSRSECSSPRQL